MQLVVRLEKELLPTHTAVCEAAAMATVRLLAAPPAQPGGEWSAAVARWHQGRIRKLVRRARGAAWEKTQTFAGVTVQHRGAVVRALVPGPTDAVDPHIAHLQLQGLDLSDPAPRTDIQGAPVVVSITPEPKLTTGKAAAAAAHAAQLAWLQLSQTHSGLYQVWESSGFEVSVEQPGKARFWELVQTAPVAVVDAGFTEIAPGTATSTARWAIDKM